MIPSKGLKMNKKFELSAGLASENNRIVRSCPKLESGLRFGPEGIRACQLGPFAAPLYWTVEEADGIKITKDAIIQKRTELFEQLNDDYSDVICKKCSMVVEKPLSDVDFTKIGRIDHSPRTICNLRCDFCGFTKAEDRGDDKNAFVEEGYDSFKFMKCFSSDDVQWDAAVDFNGGEPSLLKNIREYLEFFKNMKMKVLCFTNGVQFSRHLYDGLADGSIQWLVTSIDCGTPSTYKKTKRADVYSKVVENCAKYAHAGSLGGGSFAVKYIFTDNNCSDDDVLGFAYAMLAVRPQKVWLTYDFDPFGIIPPDSEDFGDFDFAPQIAAYAKLYKLLHKHGLTAHHYTEGHLAKISRAGKLLLQKTQEACVKAASDNINRIETESLRLDDFRHPKMLSTSEFPTFKVHQSTIVIDGQSHSLKGKRIAIAPATEASVAIAQYLQKHTDFEAVFLDKNPLMWGKKVGSFEISNYELLSTSHFDYVLICPPRQHREAIIRQVEKIVPHSTISAVYHSDANDGASILEAN